MNFKQIEAFRAVMLTGSMTSAAGLLHTSQPNVSRWISLLEQRVGFVLFQRSGTRLIPTPEADAFYADVEKAFVGLDTLNDAADSIRQRGTGLLRIGAVGSITQCVLPEALRLFRNAYPGVPVVVNMGSSDAVSKWTSTGHCDVGFCSVPNDSQNLRFERINTARGVAIVSRTHALVTRGELQPRDFDGLEFISLPGGSYNRKMIDRHFLDGRRRLSIETPYASTICALVGKGLGISIVNPVVPRALGLQEVCEIPFSEKIEFHAYSVQSSHFPVSTLSQRIITCMVDAYAEVLTGTSVTPRN